MSIRQRALLTGGALLLPVFLSPLLLSPILAIGFVCVVVGVMIAARGVAYPLALSSIFAVLIAFLGRNPFPHGAISEISFLWVAAAIVFVVVREERALPLRVLMTAPVLLTVSTAIWMLARLGASSEPAYGNFKLQLFVAVNLTFLVAGIVVARKRDTFRLLLVLTLAMAAVSAVVLSRDLATGHAQAVIGGRFAISSDYDPIIFGRDAARAITIAVFLLLVTRAPGLRLAAIAVLPLLAVSFTAAGSRGPALGLVLGLLTLLVLLLREREARRRILLVFVGGLLGASLVAQLVPGQNVSRSLSFLTGNSHDASSNGRTALWHLAWRTFADHPLFGVGTGGYHGVDPNNLYPHNLILETLAELGLIGGILVVATIVFGSLGLRTVWLRGTNVDRQDVAIVASFIAAAFANAMFSGDISTNNPLWLALGLALGLRVRTDAVPGLPQRMAAIRGLRRERQAPGTPSLGEGRLATPAPAVFPGRIVEPRAGDAVSAPVRVVVEPARSGRLVDLVRLEVARAGGWAPEAEVDERTYELELDDGPVIVRSGKLAERVAEAFGARATLSRRRPWVVPRQVELVWSPELTGECEIRAVTVEAGGGELASEPLTIHVESLAEALSAPAVAAEPEPVVEMEPVVETELMVRVPEPPHRDLIDVVVDAPAGNVLYVAGTSGDWRPVELVGGRLDTRLLPEGSSWLCVTSGDRHSAFVPLLVDNEPPTVKLVEPAPDAVLRGRVVLRADARDATSGVHSVLMQRSRDGARWRPLIGESWDTTADEDGEWLLRAVAVDRAKHVASSEPVGVTVANAVVVSEPVAPAAAHGGRPTFFALKDAVAAAQLDQLRREELEALLDAIRTYADFEGNLPDTLDDLIAAEFAPLLGGGE